MDEELTAAPAAPVVLTVLSEGESYGYEILKRVRELSEGEFAWTDAMVYPPFHRLTRLGYLTTEWRALPDGRRRNYYAITDHGRTALARRQGLKVLAMDALGEMWRGTRWLLAAASRPGTP
jgi:PadR family transcriptional regulator, regulatory protein PadR